MKKKIIVTTALLALAGLTQAPITMAAANNLLVKYDCPCTLNNLSSSITGIGSQQVGNGHTQKIQFKGSVPGNTPFDLSSYYNSNTKYDQTSGLVTCQFMSSSGWPVIYTSYLPVQEANGAVVKQTANTIHIKVPFGLRS